MDCEKIIRRLKRDDRARKKKLNEAARMIEGVAAKAQARLVKALRCKDVKLKDEHILKALEYIACEAADGK
jgi:hypothetical protein